jgi:hypothetical protein
VPAGPERGGHHRGHRLRGPRTRLRRRGGRHRRRLDRRHGCRRPLGRGACGHGGVNSARVRRGDGQGQRLVEVGLRVPGRPHLLARRRPAQLPGRDGRAAVRTAPGRRERDARSTWPTPTTTSTWASPTSSGARTW